MEGRGKKNTTDDVVGAKVFSPSSSSFKLPSFKPFLMSTMNLNSFAKICVSCIMYVKFPERQADSQKASKAYKQKHRQTNGSTYRQTEKKRCVSFRTSADGQNGKQKNRPREKWKNKQTQACILFNFCITMFIVKLTISVDDHRLPWNCACCRTTKKKENNKTPTCNKSISPSDRAHSHETLQAEKRVFLPNSSRRAITMVTTEPTFSAYNGAKTSSSISAAIFYDACAHKQVPIITELSVILLQLCSSSEEEDERDTRLGSIASLCRNRSAKRQFAPAARPCARCLATTSLLLAPFYISWRMPTKLPFRTIFPVAIGLYRGNALQPVVFPQSYCSWTSFMLRHVL